MSSRVSDEGKRQEEGSQGCEVRVLREEDAAAAPCERRRWVPEWWLLSCADLPAVFEEARVG